ncbi:MAG: hypothetical protein GY805_16625, partial [Chloroflexi bacterium]|nr:hypothetical protein [Chloroflexota bacterium]
ALWQSADHLDTRVLGQVLESLVNGRFSTCRLRVRQVGETAVCCIWNDSLFFVVKKPDSLGR